MRPTKSRSRFTRLAKATARVTGRPGMQLVINTGTTIITFVMVLDKILDGYYRLAEGARAGLRRGDLDTGVPEVA